MLQFTKYNLIDMHGNLNVDMRQLIITLIIAMLMDQIDGQYPNCVRCTDGE